MARKASWLVIFGVAVLVGCTKDGAPTASGGPQPPQAWAQQLNGTTVRFAAVTTGGRVVAGSLAFSRLRTEAAPARPGRDWAAWAVFDAVLSIPAGMADLTGSGLTVQAVDADQIKRDALVGSQGNSLGLVGPGQQRKTELRLPNVPEIERLEFSDALTFAFQLQDGKWVFPGAKRLSEVNECCQALEQARLRANGSAQARYAAASKTCAMLAGHVLTGQQTPGQIKQTIAAKLGDEVAIPTPCATAVPGLEGPE